MYYRLRFYVLHATLFQEIFPCRGKYINQAACFKSHNTVHQVGGNKKAVTLLQRSGCTIQRYFKTSGGHVRNLPVRVVMQVAHSTGFKTYTYKHQVFVVSQYFPVNAWVYLLPFQLIVFKKSCIGAFVDLFYHAALVLCGVQRTKLSFEAKLQQTAA